MHGYAPTVKRLLPSLLLYFSIIQFQTIVYSCIMIVTVSSCRRRFFRDVLFIWVHSYISTLIAICVSFAFLHNRKQTNKRLCRHCICGILCLVSMMMNVPLTCIQCIDVTHSYSLYLFCLVPFKLCTMLPTSPSVP